MASCTATAEDYCANDETTGEVPVGNLHLSDLLLGSWGASWQPEASADRSWLDREEPHPPDEEPLAFSQEWDGRPIFERLDAYGEDVLRLRRLILGR
jgi:hypothetical protein